MNYGNPYFYSQMANMGNMAGASSPGLLKSLLGGAGRFNWGSLLSNTQKTIGIVNQAIPVVKQVSPMFRNARTMFKVMDAFKKVDTPESKQSNSVSTNKPRPTSYRENIESYSGSIESKKGNEERDLVVEKTENLYTNKGPRFFI